MATMTREALIAEARECGETMALAYEDEFDRPPHTDGPERVGDWDAAAWSDDWTTLRNLGASDADYDACLAAWREAFWA